MCECEEGNCETLLLEGNPFARCAVEPTGNWMPMMDECGFLHLEFKAALNPAPNAPDGIANIVVTAYHGEMDGKPVVQIDTGIDVDFRINVNDAPIWDRSTDSDPWAGKYTHPDHYADWRMEVANEDTLLGWVDWLMFRLEQEG